MVKASVFIGRLHSESGKLGRFNPQSDRPELRGRIAVNVSRRLGARIWVEDAMRYHHVCGPSSLSNQLRSATMPGCRLEPLEVIEGHRDWRTSQIAITAWLCVRDSEDARRKMALVTTTTIEGYEVGQVIPYSPWLNSAVVNCDEDASRDVPDEVVPLSNGKTINL